MAPFPFSFLVLLETDLRQFKIFPEGLCYDRTMNIPKRAPSNIEIKIIKNSYGRIRSICNPFKKWIKSKGEIFQTVWRLIPPGNRSIFFHSRFPFPEFLPFSKRSSPINISCLISSNIFITTKYEFRLFSRSPLHFRVFSPYTCAHNTSIHAWTDVINERSF